MYCPSPCPEAWDTLWDQNPLHSRLGQILKIFQVSFTNLSQDPGMDVPGNCGQLWTECPLRQKLKFFKYRILVRSSPTRMDKIRLSPRFWTGLSPRLAVDTGPTVPHLAQSPCPVPVHVQRPGTHFGTKIHSTPGLAKFWKLSMGLSQVGPRSRDGRPWSQWPAGDRMSTLDKFEIFLSPES